jgi:hypothetical protein
MKASINTVLLLTLLACNETVAYSADSTLDQANIRQIRSSVDAPPGYFAFDADCGATVISSDGRTALTAFHCLKKRLTRKSRQSSRFLLPIAPADPSAKISLGQCFDVLEIEDSAPYELLASGGCFTGHDPNFLARNYKSSEDFKMHFALIQRDWAIVRIKASAELGCAKIQESFQEGDKVTIAGYPLIEMTEKFGIVRSSTDEFGLRSEGEILGANFLTNPHYRLKDEWATEVATAFNMELNSHNLILTSAKVMPGFSGGPISINGRLVGISNVSFGPPNATSEELLWGVNLGLSVQSLLANQTQLRGYFNCR